MPVAVEDLSNFKHVIKNAVTNTNFMKRKKLTFFMNKEHSVI
jgi:hypothetical protein